ncbi:MAG: hypothetical protein Tsb0013_23890 [Phycisphaerales bacterium]
MIAFAQPSPHRDRRDHDRVRPEHAENHQNRRDIPDPLPVPLAPETLDLRRSLHREHAERIVAHAVALPPQDRAMVESVYEQGLTVARLAGLRGECPRALRRRLRSVIARVLSPRYAFVLGHRHTWTPARRKIATAVVLHGRSMRAAASALGYSFHTVRKEMQLVDALFEAAVGTGEVHA